MAVTKIKALSGRLDNAINYIRNFKKTENGELIYSFGCVPELADMQMMTYNKEARGTRLGYHLIQSFDPEDGITPEKAFELGKEFADRVLGGKYQYILATHSDKAHIHNHIVFNATSFVTKTKYHWDNGEKQRIRDVSDEICRANNLSVIEEYTHVSDRNWIQWSKEKQNQSWKNTLQRQIDDAITRSTNFEDFCKKLEEDYGIYIRVGKTITFKITYNGTEYTCRDRRLGEAYSPDAIRNRIVNKTHKRYFVTTKSRGNSTWNEMRIYRISDVASNEKAASSAAYAAAMYKNNATARLHTFNYIHRMGYDSSDEFLEYYHHLEEEKRKLNTEIREHNEKIKEAREKIKHYNNYKNALPIYNKLWDGDDKIRYSEKDEEALQKMELAMIYFKIRGINDPSKLDISDCYRTIKESGNQKKELTGQKKSLLDELNRNKIIASNLHREKGKQAHEKYL